MLSFVPMSRPRLLLFFAVLLTAILASAAAGAQSIAPPSLTYNPTRSSSPNDPPRPENLNPTGVSYLDCTSDMTLTFNLSLSGLDGTESVQVWASESSTCVNPTDRGIGSTSAVCWSVSPSLQPTVILNPATVQFTVRVQDLVGWQSTPPTNPASPGPKGSEACTAQSGFAAVPMLINFLAINSDNQSVGTPYSYQINTDLVGPPAPLGVCETVGETIYNLDWTPNSDSDTIGYAIYVDPIPGQEPAVGTVEAGYGGGCGSDAANTCNDPVLIGAIIAEGGTGTGVDAGIDAGTDAGTDTGTAAEPDTGTGTTPTDDAGETEAGVPEGPAGISTVSPTYIYKPTNGVTVPDKTTNSFQITGLVDYITYNVAIAAVDGSGNIGPPAAEVCDYPAPVQDFWQVYEADGGGPGGYCSLGISGPSLAGVACVLVVAGVVRRQRRRRK
jgi:hypothetical protein